jgi:two-component system KDP operon response regulator KdpE
VAAEPTLELVRRSNQGAGSEDTNILDPDDAVVETAAFTIDLAARKVIRHGEELRLTPTEWAILDILVRHRGALVTQRRLLTAVWGPNYRTQTNYLRVYLAQLRQKLEPEPSRPRYLITEPGMATASKHRLTSRNAE